MVILYISDINYLVKVKRKINIANRIFFFQHQAGEGRDIEKGKAFSIN